MPAKKTVAPAPAGPTLLERVAKYRKFLTALVGAVLAWLATAYVPDGDVTRTEWYALAVALTAALGVYSVPNHPDNRELDDA